MGNRLYILWYNVKSHVALHAKGYVIGSIAVFLVAAAVIASLVYSNAKSSGERALSNIPRSSMLPVETPSSSASPTPKTSASSSGYVEDVVPGEEATSASETPSPSATAVPTQKDSSGAQKKPGDGSMNILLIGSDARPGDKDSRSDSLMVAHIDASRENVYLVSIPRDVYTDIPGHPKQKVNAAYELGGPSLTVETVQNLLGIHIDHVAITNFNGFMDLVDTVGGVTVNNPFDGCDDNQNKCWKSGSLTMDKNEALSYVRWRHGLPEGDISRTQNQQRVVKAIAEKLVTSGALMSPSKVDDISNKLSNSVTLDETMTNDVIIDLAKSTKIRSSDDIKSVGVPISGFGSDPTYGSVDLLDESKMAQLRQSLGNDSMEQYYSSNAK